MTVLEELKEELERCKSSMKEYDKLNYVALKNWFQGRVDTLEHILKYFELGLICENKFFEKGDIK